jgi:AcrR family transcriptional regulator
MSTMNERGDTPLAEERRAELLDAALGVFARYGYRKASMDEVARAAGLSRQGLYLHFPSKEVLFRAVVAFLLDRALQAAEAALADEAQPVDERLRRAFEAMHGHYMDTVGSTPHLAELLEAARDMVGGLIDEKEGRFVDAVARVLTQAGIAARFSGIGLSARDLAGTLQAVSYGLKHRACTRVAYADGMRIAVRILCHGRTS